MPKPDWSAMQMTDAQATRHIIENMSHDEQIETLIEMFFLLRNTIATMQTGKPGYMKLPRPGIPDGM